MKSQRQQRILELISRYEIETQEDMMIRLQSEGFNVTQATVSRDLKELNDKYKIIEITPLNMFPRTYHCESVTILERR